MEIFKQNESGVRSYCRSFPVVFNKAQGAELFSEDGTRYIDFLAGAGTLNYGHNHPVLKQALLEYIERDGLTHGLDMYSKAKERFLETFNRIILEPRGMQDYLVQFTGPTGTNAVEAALKLARKVTGRSSVISFTNGFHGCSMGALAATGNQHHRGAAGTALNDVSRMPYANYFGKEVSTIVMMKKLLEDPSSGIDKPAAVIVEVVQGEGGLNTASADWMRQLEKLCRQHGMLLIVDDIQAGCGRTGTFFSFEEMGVQPDIITLSKSLSGYGLPFAVVLLKKELDQWKPGEHNGTFRGNNPAFVTATAALRRYWADDSFQNGHLTQVIDTIQDALTKIAIEVEGTTVKGRGLLTGLSFQDSDVASKVAAKGFEKGLLMETSGPKDEVLKLMPAMTIELDVLERGLRILADVVSDVTGQEITLVLGETANV